MQDYEIRDCRGADEYPEILRLLEASFVSGEPTLKMFLEQNKHRIDQEERIVIMDDLRRRYEILLENSLCRVVVHQEKVVGVNLMYVEDNPRLESGKKSYYGLMDQVKSRSNLLDEYLECIIHQAEEDVNFFEAYPHVRKTLELVIMSIDENHRSRGLATALVQDSVKLAKANKIDLIFGQFTSPYSKRAVEKIGFQTYLDVDAMKLRDFEGNAFYDGTDAFVISEMFMFVD